MERQIPVYKKNQFVVKLYGSGDQKKIQVTVMNSLRTDEYIGFQEVADKGTVNDEKLSNNIIRARSRIFELAFCNEWSHFFTATISPEHYSRSDLQKFHKDYSKWICNYNRLNDCGVRYLIVPELHADGCSWHFHGFVQGIPDYLLHRFVVGDVMSSKIAYRVKCGYELYDWPAYHNKFGFCDLEPIRNHLAVSKYITKYISKDLGRSVSEVNAHMFYHSRGLKSAEKITSGSCPSEFFDFPFDYHSDYCSYAWLDYDPDLLSYLVSLSGSEEL